MFQNITNCAINGTASAACPVHSCATIAQHDHHHQLGSRKRRNGMMASKYPSASTIGATWPSYTSAVRTDTPLRRGSAATFAAISSMIPRPISLRRLISTRQTERRACRSRSIWRPGRFPSREAARQACRHIGVAETAVRHVVLLVHPVLSSCPGSVTEQNIEDDADDCYCAH